MNYKEKIKDGYSYCKNSWILDQNIKNELNILLLISSLTAFTGYCYASNSYFSKIFEIDEKTISRKIKKLEQLGYIEITYKRRGCEVIARHIKLTSDNSIPDETKKSLDDTQKNHSTSDKKVEENNISYNNSNYPNKYISDKKENKRFIKPTLEEIKEYCLERKNNIDAQYFLDYYDSNGWVIGKNKPMKDWKAAIRTWERNNTNRLGRINEKDRSEYTPRIKWD